MALKTQWTIPSLCVIYVCVCLCVCTRARLCLRLCLPPRFNYSTFPVQIQFGFSMFLLFSPPPPSPRPSPHSFVYYLIRRGSQRLGGGGGWVAIVSQRGRRNYVLLQTHREKGNWPCVAAPAGAESGAFARPVSRHRYPQSVDYIMSPRTHGYYY